MTTEGQYPSRQPAVAPRGVICGREAVVSPRPCPLSDGRADQDGRERWFAVAGPDLVAQDTPAACAFGANQKFSMLCLGQPCCGSAASTDSWMLS